MPREMEDRAMRGLVLQDRERTPLDEVLTRARRSMGKRTGIIQSLLEGELKPDDFGLFKFYAFLCHTSRFAPVESSRKTGSGSVTRERAKAAGVGEALERYCLSLYDTDDFIFASRRELQHDAVAPERCILFSEKQYATPGFGYSRFSDDSKVKWVWGYSLVQEKPVLVPASYVYMPYIPASGEARIQGSVTTGAATGASVEEAILCGIYEVIERDAFAITWLNRLPVPSVSLRGIKNPLLQRIVDRLHASSFKLLLNYIATDIEIPVFFGMLVDESGRKPILAAGAAANLDPEMALLKTLEEAVLTRGLGTVLVEGDRKLGFLHLQKFEDLKDFNDHVLLYAWRDDLGEAWDFLLKNEGSVAIDEIPNRSCGRVLTDISVCLEKLTAKGMDVVVVDITTPDVAEIGFAVVKVIIPGLQPLNGNYNYRHLGGTRLYEVPEILGYTEKATEESSLNPYPHPFP